MKEPKQHRVETLVKSLITRKYKHFDETNALQTEVLNFTCFDLKGEGSTHQEEAIGCFRTIEPK